jgi:hypothetical protein
MVPIKKQETTLKFSRKQIAALGASAILVLGGASVVLAQNPQSQPSPAATDSAVEDPATGPDTDNIQDGDQTGPDEAGGVEDGAEDSGGPDTDAIEEGDQTSPDTSVQAAPSAQSGAVTVAAKPVKADSAQTQSAAAPKAQAAPDTESESPESESAESDGPGGHEDPAGENTDHQFDGEE